MYSRRSVLFILNLNMYTMHNNTNSIDNTSLSYCFALVILQLQDLKNLQKHITFSSVVIYKGVYIRCLHMTNIHRDNSTA